MANATPFMVPTNQSVTPKSVVRVMTSIKMLLAVPTGNTRRFVCVSRVWPRRRSTERECESLLRGASWQNRVGRARFSVHGREADAENEVSVGQVFQRMLKGHYRVNAAGWLSR